MKKIDLLNCKFDLVSANIPGLANHFENHMVIKRRKNNCLTILNELFDNIKFDHLPTSKGNSKILNQVDLFFFGSGTS